MNQTSCIVPGCDNKHHARGWCGKHYYRWRQHGDPLAGGTPHGLPLAWIGELLAAAPSDDCIVHLSIEVVAPEPMCKATSSKGNNDWRVISEVGENRRLCKNCADPKDRLAPPWM